MRVIVDGYNVAMSDPATVGLPADEQRAALVRRLAARGQTLFGTCAIVVVFDGRSDGAVESVGSVEARFSGDRIADDVIVGLARPGDVVVTSDRELTERCQKVGARVLPGKSAFEGAKPSRKSRRTRYPASTVGIPDGGNLITEELKRLWLDDESSEQESET
ncbi:MAG: NYN domain-containing protein [Coriobacteriia bacterium]|nr:NYN domain-containing protein [Coriobacteriia bacterium]